MVKYSETASDIQSIESPLEALSTSFNLDSQLLTTRGLEYCIAKEPAHLLSLQPNLRFTSCMQYNYSREPLQIPVFHESF